MKTKPSKATDVIKVLNSKNKEEIEDINISKRTTTILEIKKVLQKRNLIIQLETKCQTLDIFVDPGLGVTKDTSKTFYFCGVLNWIFKRT